MRGGWFPVLMFAVCCLAGCGKRGDGLVKHQVSGSVLVNGQPYPFVVAQFHHTNPAVEGNAAMPVAATDSDGKFRLSTNGDKDGAIAGEYIVTFFWTNNGPSATDLLRGKYSKKESSQQRVTIKEGDVELEPIKLEIPADWLTAAQNKLQAATTSPME